MFEQFCSNCSGIWPVGQNHICFVLVLKKLFFNLWNSYRWVTPLSDTFFFFFRGIIEARFVYVFVLGIIFTGTKDLLRSQVTSADSKTKITGLWEIYSGLVLLAALLSRPHNLPVLVFCLLIQLIMTRCIWTPLKFDAAQITIMHYWFGQAFFYFQVRWRCDVNGKIYLCGYCNSWC